MPIDAESLARVSPRVLGLLRIVTAFLFIQHATAKFFGVPHVAMFDGLQLMSLIGLAGVIELVGGALLLLGLFTRPAAFILSGEMAVAYFMAHASTGMVLSPMLYGGELMVSCTDPSSSSERSSKASTRRRSQSARSTERR